MNTFGNIFTVTTFGESHGIGVGGVIDGMPAGITVDMDFIQSSCRAVVLVRVPSLQVVRKPMK